MGILVPKPGPKQDIKEEKEIKKEDGKNINALPDFEIRTMKDDLAGLGVKRGDKNLLMREVTLPKITKDGPLPVVPKPNPQTEIIQGKEIEEEKYQKPKNESYFDSLKKPESGMIVPENLPVAPVFKKSSLPSTEELISKEKESPLAPLPPKEPETFFITEEEKEEAPQKKEKSSGLPQMEKLKIPEPVYAPEKENIRKILRIVTAGLIGLAIIGAGLFVYFKNRPSQTEINPEIKIEPQLSAPLISIEEKSIASISEERNVFQLLKSEARNEQKLRTFKRIGVLKNEKDFLSLSEIFEGLEIKISPYAFSAMQDNYNLLIFNQETGKRLGIIVEINNPENLKIQMLNWEATMLEDFKNFYPIELPGQPASKNFLDDNYKNVIIRYKNLPLPTLTLNYTILGNYLIICTSKDMIYSTIDRILVK